MTPIIIGIIMIAIACHYFDEAIRAKKEQRRRDQARKAALWQDLG